MSAQIPPTASYLTDALRKSSALNDVLDVVVKGDRSTLLSRILRLRLTYPSAEPDEPQTIILKTGLANAAKGTWNGGRQEVAFYTKVPRRPPCPTCEQGSASIV
jgi:hypothetical protein